MNTGPVARSPQSSRDLVSAPQTTNLADLLERVLDKGIVIAGDITLFLGGVQLLTLRIRLLVTSIDKAQEIGINWWQSDPFLSSRAKEQELASRTKEQDLEGERDLLKERLDRLERLLLAPPQEADQERAQEPEAEQNAAPGEVVDAALGSVLDTAGTLIPEPKQAREAERPQVAPERAPEPETEQPAALASVRDKAGRLIAELKPSREEEQPQTRERAPQPQAAQVDQPAGGGPLLGQPLQEHIAQAMRPVLGVVQQRSAQAPQPVEQGRPAERQKRSNRRRAPGPPPESTQPL
jgi:Gas vesicle protein